MKKAVSFLLTFVYLVFITGSFWTVQDSTDYSFDNTADFTAYSIEGAKEWPLKISDTGEANHVKPAKFAKHIASAGKIKVPRAGLYPVVFKNFIAFENSSCTLQAAAAVRPSLCQENIYIKNGVLRI